MGYIHRAVEMGGSLNFKIVGGTVQPASPKENTIWINTDTTIGEYQFLATEPTTRADGTAFQNGDVWIRTVSDSHIFFNALKKNGIRLCPYTAYQHNGAGWVSKEAKLFQCNEWQDFIRYVYRYGNEYKDITGEWSANISGSNYYDYPGTITKNADSITLSASNEKALVCKTAKPLDFTEFKTMLMHITTAQTSGSANGIKFGYRTNNNYNLEGDAHTTVTSNKSTTITDTLFDFDITTVSGEKYPFVAINANSSNSVTCTFDAIYFL